MFTYNVKMDWIAKPCILPWQICRMFISPVNRQLLLGKKTIENETSFAVAGLLVNVVRSHFLYVSVCTPL